MQRFPVSSWRRRWASGALLLAASLGSAHAQAKAKDIAGVAESYLRAMAAQDFPAAVKLVERQSLVDMKADQVAVLKAAPTMKHEEVALERLGIPDISVLEEMDADEAFILRSKAQFQRSEDPEREETVLQVSKTLKFKVLAVVEETPELAHVVLRSTHERKDKRVSALDFVSLVKEGSAWKVSLNAQEPQITGKE